MTLEEYQKRMAEIMKPQPPGFISETSRKVLELAELRDELEQEGLHDGQDQS